MISPSTRRQTSGGSSSISTSKVDPVEALIEAAKLAPKEEGRKDDGGKTQLELLPYDALEEVGKVLTFGAKKYAPRNWEKGMAWSRLIGSSLRHIFAWANGQDKDPETNLSHLAHAACCILFLLSYSLRSIGVDDRAKLA